MKVLGLDPWERGYELHKRIGVIPQEFTFFEKTKPREAIVYYASLFGIKVDPDEILKEVLLEDSAENVFDNLSGGQKQKTGLALSIVNSPDLLFLDEPTTGLDPNARRSARATKYVDFLIPGLVGFSILVSPMFSLVNVSSEYKKNKLFKQLSLTPLTKMEWLISKIL